MRLTHCRSRRRSPRLRRARSSGGAKLRPDAGGGGGGGSWSRQSSVPLSPAVYSYAHWMLRPSSLPFGVRSAEWVRDDVPSRQLDGRQRRAHLLQAERPEDGRRAAEEPACGRAGRGSSPTSRAAAWPPPIKPVFAHPLPGEGIWKATGPPVDGGPPVLPTTFRPESQLPSQLSPTSPGSTTRAPRSATTRAARAAGAAVRGPMMVPDDQRWRLLEPSRAASSTRTAPRLDRQRPHE